MHLSKRNISLVACCLGLCAVMGAQEVRVSPPATAEVKLNGKPVSISYSRPSKRGRKIMGDLVPYGEVWRTGANEATTLKTAVSMDVAGVHVPAGVYTLYSMPSQSGWKLIINKQTGQWGTEYDPSQDLARVSLQVSKLPPAQAVETFTIAFDKKSAGTADLVMSWEQTRLTLPLKAE